MAGGMANVIDTNIATTTTNVKRDMLVPANEAFDNNWPTSKQSKTKC